MKSQSGGLRGASLSRRKKLAVAIATAGLRRGILGVATNRNIARLILRAASTVFPQKLSGSSTTQIGLRALLSLNTLTANSVTFSHRIESGPRWKGCAERRATGDANKHRRWLRIGENAFR